MLNPIAWWFFFKNQQQQKAKQTQRNYCNESAKDKIELYLYMHSINLTADKGFIQSARIRYTGFWWNSFVSTVAVNANNIQHKVTCADPEHFPEGVIFGILFCRKKTMIISPL